MRTISILLTLAFVGAQAAVPLNLEGKSGWTFNPPSSTNSFFSDSIPDFGGTFTKDDTSPTLLLLVPSQQVSLSLSDMEKWINQTYFKGKAIRLTNSIIAGAQSKKYLMVFQIFEEDTLRVVPIYALKHQGRLLLISMESNLETYQSDLKKAHELIRAL